MGWTGWERRSGSDPRRWPGTATGTLLTYAFAHAVPGRGQPVYVGFHLVTNVVPFFCIAPQWSDAAARGGCSWSSWPAPPDRPWAGMRGTLGPTIS